MKKLCQEGDHYVDNLFWSAKPYRKSACMRCARKYGKPLPYNPKVKLIDSNNPLNEAKPRGVRSHKPKEDKTVAELLKLTQIAFNRWIKKRDSFDKMFYCISSGKLCPLRDMTAGHYYPVSTSSNLRFDEDNVHGQSLQENFYNGSHQEGYRKNLINKIGEEAMERLDREAHKEKKWTKQELLDIIDRYK